MGLASLHDGGRSVCGRPGCCGTHQDRRRLGLHGSHPGRVRTAAVRGATPVGAAAGGALAGARDDAGGVARSHSPEPAADGTRQQLVLLRALARAAARAPHQPHRPGRSASARHPAARARRSVRLRLHRQRRARAPLRRHRHPRAHRGGARGLPDRRRACPARTAGGDRGGASTLGGAADRAAVCDPADLLQGTSRPLGAADRAGRRLSRHRARAGRRGRGRRRLHRRALPRRGAPRARGGGCAGVGRPPRSQRRVRRPPARRGQDRGAQGDRQQARQARPRRVGDHQDPHDRGSADARARRRLHARGWRDRTLLARALGWRGLPRPATGHRDPARGPHRLRLRRLQRDDHNPLLSQGDEHPRRHRRAQALRRHPVRPASRGHAGGAGERRRRFRSGVLPLRAASVWRPTSVHTT